MTKTVAADEIAHSVSFGFETQNYFGEWDIELVTYGDGFIMMYAYPRPVMDIYGPVYLPDFEDVEIGHEEVTVEFLQRTIEDLLEAENERAYEAAMDRYYGG